MTVKKTRSNPPVAKERNKLDDPNHQGPSPCTIQTLHGSHLSEPHEFQFRNCSVGTDDGQSALSNKKASRRSSAFISTLWLLRSTGKRNPQPGTPYVLAPSITVTSESARLCEGQMCFWAAIEIMGKLCHTSSGQNASNKEAVASVESPIDHQLLDRSFKYGCLYNLSVEVQPASSTSIMQVLQEHNFPTTICAGSGVLLLAQIRFKPENRLAANGRKQHVRQTSEELIEDLEMQLGDFPMETMHIKVSYSHSAFPENPSTETLDGVSAVHSRMETMAMATVKRHDSRSPWSPPAERSPERLLPLIERHWGAQKAAVTMQQILAHYSVSREQAICSTQGGTRDSFCLAAPLVPIRKASLNHEATTKTPEAARRYWTEVQRKPSEPMLILQGFRSNIGSCGPVTPSHNPFAYRGDWENGCRLGNNKRPLRKRWSFGTEALKTLAPSIVGASENRTNTGHGAMVRVSRSKDSGLWSWASWF